MVYFAGAPPEVVEQVIDALQDDQAALKACSQTCRSLLPMCRKYLFRTVDLTRPWSSPQLPRVIVLFGRLLDSNPGIADYVRILLYRVQSPDFEDNDVPRILEQLHRVQIFRLNARGVNWNTLRPSFRESLSNLIQSRSVTRLEISYLKNFPITTFIPCINLIDLKLVRLVGVVVASDGQEFSMSGAIPQLQTFTFGVGGSGFAKGLFEARRSDNLPVDFTKLRTLDIDLEEYSDLVVTHRLINAAENLETLSYGVDCLINGFAGLAASMNKSSFSTLRRLRFGFDICSDIQDPLCGLCEELSAFAAPNVIEEISLEIVVDCQCKTGEEWGRLDAVLANGFHKLNQVSLRIVITVFSSYSRSIALQEKLNKLPDEQFPRLSKNSRVTFDFSTTVHLI